MRQMNEDVDVRSERSRVWRLLISAGVATALAVGITGGTNPARAATLQEPAATINYSTGLGQSDVQEVQLDRIVNALESLPEDLKNADPVTTPGYEQRLEEALGGLTVVDGLQVSSMSALSATGVMSVQTNWGKCAIEVAKVIVTYGIPVAKVVKWIKEARAIWGGVSGIYWAIRSGAAAAEIGGEAASILEGILGIGGVKTACFG